MSVASLLGLNVIDTLICVGANNLKTTFENEDFLRKAYEIGKELSMYQCSIMQL